MKTSSADPAAGAGLAFDHAYLDDLMERAGLEGLLVTSKHNVQYLLGGHRSNFFNFIDAIGVSRYLPIVVYQKGRPERTLYVGTRTEAHEHAVAPIPVPQAVFPSWTVGESVEAALVHLRDIGMTHSRIGIETAFLPVDAHGMLQEALPDCTLEDGFAVLERLRARKTPGELRLLRQASEGITSAMLATLSRHGGGSSKAEIAQTLREEETVRGLDFEYCLISMGSTINRAPSDQRWRPGETLSVDSGGSYHGYIGDLARMAVLGEPDQELIDILGDVEAIQQAAIGRIAPGAIGTELYAAADEVIANSAHRDVIKFVAHGVGVITHEIPHLTDDGPVPYPATDAARPLEAGMVLSVETDLLHPSRGFIKLEDTIAVTETGHEMYGEEGRGWNVVDAN